MIQTRLTSNFSALSNKRRLKLIAVVNGKIGVFRYRGEVVWCPVRLLQKL